MASMTMTQRSLGLNYSKPVQFTQNFLIKICCTPCLTSWMATAQLQAFLLSLAIDECLNDSKPVKFLQNFLIKNALLLATCALMTQIPHQKVFGQFEDQTCAKIIF